MSSGKQRREVPDWDLSQARRDMAKPCDYCGRVGEMKARATQDGKTRLFCHTADFSCYNACRGRYFEPCSCDKVLVLDQAICDEHERWFITHRDPACRLHISPVRV